MRHIAQCRKRCERPSKPSTNELPKLSRDLTGATARFRLPAPHTRAGQAEGKPGAPPASPTRVGA
jgi:hypothetical protein